MLNGQELRIADPQLPLFESDAPAPDWAAHPIFAEVEPHVFDHFKRFHAENSHVYFLFRKFAHMMKNSGRELYSAKAIMERLRWHQAFETNAPEHKISNSLTSCYLRLLIVQEPAFEPFLRRQRKR